MKPIEKARNAVESVGAARKAAKKVMTAALSDESYDKLVKDLIMDSRKAVEIVDKVIDKSGHYVIEQCKIAKTESKKCLNAQKEIPSAARKKSLSSEKKVDVIEEEYKEVVSTYNKCAEELVDIKKTRETLRGKWVRKENEIRNYKYKILVTQDDDDDDDDDEEEKRLDAEHTLYNLTAERDKIKEAWRKYWRLGAKKELELKALATQLEEANKLKKEEKKPQDVTITQEMVEQKEKDDRKRQIMIANNAWQNAYILIHQWQKEKYPDS